MIDLPANAEVRGSDGLIGLSTFVIGNPITNQVTHLVVKSILPPFSEKLVPVELIEETTPHMIRLMSTRNEVEKMEPFVYEEYICTKYPTYVMLPYTLPSQVIMEEVVDYVPVKHHNIPSGELAVWRGAKVVATDGYVGRVDELLMNSKNMQATHLILRERHIFKQRDITIPVSQIDHVYEDTIFLKLDRQSVDELPTTPIQRWQIQEKPEAIKG